MTSATQYYHNVFGIQSSSLWKGLPYPPTSDYFSSPNYYRTPTCTGLSTSYCQPSSDPNDSSVMELLFHFTWSWMSHDDTVCLCMVFPVMSCYGRCRHQALSLSKLDIKNLTTTLDFTLSPRSPDNHRVKTLGQLAILCDFDIRILIRSLNKNYTDDWTDFDAVEDLIQEMETVPHVPPGLVPVQEFDQVRNTIHHGFPFKKEFSCPLHDVRLRNLWDNQHSSINDHEPLLLEKLAEDVNHDIRTLNNCHIRLSFYWTIKIQ